MMSETQSDIVSWWYLINCTAMTLLCLVKLPRAFESRRELVLYSVTIGFFWPISIPLVAFMSASDSLLEVISDVKLRKEQKVRK